MFLIKEKKRALELGTVHKEITVRTIRRDGLLEEKSCNMIDFLNFMGFEVQIEGENKNE